MGQRISVTAGNGGIGNITSWNAEEDATANIIGSGSGGVGSLHVEASVVDKSDFLNGNTVVFSSDDYGTFQSTLDNNEVTGVTVAIDGPGLLGQCNVDVTALPVYGTSALSDAINYYLSLVFEIPPTVNYIATNNPLVAFPGWTGNLWDNFNQLCAAFRIEIAVVDGVVTVRDIGTSTIDITNVISDDSINRVINSQNIAANVTIVNHETSSASSLPGFVHNFSTNPSLESNTTGWSEAFKARGGFVTVTHAGSLTASGRTTGGSPPKGSYAATGVMTEEVGSASRSGGSVAIYHWVSCDFISSFIGLLGTMPTFFSMAARTPATSLTISDIQNSSYILTPKVVWMDASGSVISSQTGASLSVGANVWNTVSMSATAPALAVKGQFIVNTGSYAESKSRTTTPGTGLIAYADKAFCSEASATYFDGSDGGSAGWTGTTNNSISYNISGDAIVFYDALSDNNNIISCASGQVQIIQLTTTNFPAQLTQPTQTTSFPITPGTFYVSDTNGLPVSPASFQAYGGSVTVALGDTPGTIQLTFTAPRQDIPASAGPYSLAVSSNSTQFAALSIVGAGVVSQGPENIIWQTAAPRSLTKIDGPVVDVPFVNSLAQAQDLAQDLAGLYSGSNVVISLTLPVDVLGDFGTINGSILSSNFGKFRVMTAAIQNANVAITAAGFVRGSDLDAIFGGRAISVFDSVWNGYTGAEMAVRPLWH